MPERVLHLIQAVTRLLEIGCDGLLDLEQAGNSLLRLRLLDEDDNIHVVVLKIESHDFTPTPSAPTLYGRPGSASADLVRSLGLPMYLSREWLVGKLYELGSTDAVAEAEGYPEALLDQARKAHEIDNVLTEYLRLEWETGAYAKHDELARAAGVSRTTVSKAVGKVRDQDAEPDIRRWIAEGLTNTQIIAELRAAGDRRVENKLKYLIRKLRD